VSDVARPLAECQQLGDLAVPRRELREPFPEVDAQRSGLGWAALPPVLDHQLVPIPDPYLPVQRLDLRTGPKLAVPATHVILIAWTADADSTADPAYRKVGERRRIRIVFATELDESVIRQEAIGNNSRDQLVAQFAVTGEGNAQSLFIAALISLCCRFGFEYHVEHWMDRIRQRLAPRLYLF